MAAEPCRYAGNLASHVCSRNDGSPVGAHGVCFVEAVAQLREQGVDHEITDPAVYRVFARNAPGTQAAAS